MTPLFQILRRQIKATGPLSVADYMAACLCHPKHGYYMTRDPFGEQGDFTTSPEISQVYGELLGLWSAIVWQQMDSPQKIKLIELGAGRGSLMSDALRAAQKLPEFYQALDVHLVEISPILKEHQRQALSGHHDKITWHNDLGEIEDGASIIVANEFFDALPVRQFEKTDKGWAERFIDLSQNEEALRFVLKPDDSAPAYLPSSLKDDTEATLFEICPSAQSIARVIAERLCQFGGAALIVDYGHQKSTFGESLQALNRHHYSNVLENCGENDLTCHVDFESLTCAFSQAGAKTHTLLTQGEFLERLGIAQRFQALLQKATPEQQTDLISAHKRLVSPDEMGNLFKVMCATHPDHPCPPAFEG